MIKKILLIVMIFLLSGCKTEYINISEYETLPNRIMVTYGKSENGEAQSLEPLFSFIYSNDDLYYYYNFTYYVLNEDDTFTLIDTFFDASVGYKMHVDKEVLEIDGYTLLNYALNKEYKSAFWSNVYTYQDEEMKIDVIDTSLDSLHFKLYLSDTDYIYEIRVLSETEFLLPEYNMSSEDVDLFLVTRDESYVSIDQNTLTKEYQDQEFLIHLDELSYSVYVESDLYEYDFKTDIMCKTRNDMKICDPEGYTNSDTIKIHEHFYWEFLDDYFDIHFELVELFERYEQYVLDK